jgi:hypothetical protein
MRTSCASAARDETHFARRLVRDGALRARRASPELDFERECRVVLRTGRARRESLDRSPVPRRLAQLHVRANHRVEALLGEERANLAQSLPRITRAAVVERAQDAHVQRVADAIREQPDRLEQLLHAVHGELARLEWHDHLARSAQRIESEHAYVGRAID